MKNLKRFFSPRSVAVIGASSHPKKIGHVIFRNFVKEHFKGKVYPVNPNTESILGHKCYRSILDIKHAVDLAVVAVKANITPRILEECAKKGTKNIIIISGGFKEVGNVELEKKTEAVIEKYGLNVIGPNCVGIFNPYTGTDTLFLPTYRLGRPERGEISFVSQSGALGMMLLDWMKLKGYKLSKFISYGNAIDVDEADLIEYLWKDDETKIICVYMEGAKDGRKFFNIAKKVAKDKPIIVLKAGQTEAGKVAASSHTGALAGSYKIYSSVFRQTGILEAEGLENLFDYARILAYQSDPLPKGRRVQIITNGGGYGVLTADQLVKNGLKLAKPSAATIKRIKEGCPPHVIVKNPIDLTGDADSERYRLAIDAAVNDDGIDMIVVILLPQTPILSDDVVDVIAEAASKKRKPLIVLSAGGGFAEVLKKSIEECGIPTYSYPDKAASALSVLYRFSENNKRK
ncbi:MAG: CoA-binding protein [Candidatus Micrarchaeota archaeon]|nr:CoA-binding protein [Candidatus Micrarchaeota archaeon]